MKGGSRETQTKLEEQSSSLRADLAGLSLADQSEPISLTTLSYAYEALERDSSAPLTLSICLPFCPSIDLTCDRVAIAGQEPEVVERYVAGIEAEISLVARRLGEHRLLNRLHISGASPNYLSDIALARIFSAINNSFDIWEETKVSFELDPRRTSRSQLNFLCGLGVKDLHLQVRDIDPTVQGQIGRIQSVELLEDVINISRGTRFESIGIDQLYGLPGQSVDSFEKSLDSLVSLAPDWVEFHTFVMRENAFPHQIAVSERELPTLADKLFMLNALGEVMKSSGYEWVGLNLFAREDHPLALVQGNGGLSLNVLGYSLQPQSWVVGIGLGAISELPGMIVQNHASLETWQKMVDDNFLTAATGVVDDNEKADSRIILRQLMCNQLVSYEVNNGANTQVLHPLIDSGFVELQGSSLTVTELGREFLPYLLSDSSPAYRSI